MLARPVHLVAGRHLAVRRTDLARDRVVADGLLHAGVEDVDVADLGRVVEAEELLALLFELEEGVHLLQRVRDRRLGLGRVRVDDLLAVHLRLSVGVRRVVRAGGTGEGHGDGEDDDLGTVLHVVLGSLLSEMNEWLVGGQLLGMQSVALSL